ncbi:hypothetical protein HETIRDRAFT_419206 [Heterobasidion irregulare TC 32-1]|uniref:Uncharacterized protein n=1 Tax=Heterobasidion irregulare (strain TC 32-1) TaxID=747525 RepID=W4K2B0_HETIT|nr:uncharacterized protein HETIRDRAFT_321883 [Heterobasidion irregulare TC 32-1]XP_009548070.1 uncharacterized protein HETIRDRAFT_419206 [Heterobasidion irregulare TC 32-1]ETW79428.1 hypothetical protein HETIRDRAFT_321883 [Heterobasidion irregulare TC 32-1]ETW79485.1 hypothetical protein HETIRDRAFT_419206 [Heterobasidion irregulare TC 32-1]
MLRPRIIWLWQRMVGGCMIDGNSSIGVVPCSRFGRYFFHLRLGARHGSRGRNISARAVVAKYYLSSPLRS